MIVDVPAPGQTFIGHALAKAGCKLAQQEQVVQQLLAIAAGFGRAVRAQQDQVGAQIVHHRELAPHAFQRAIALIGGHALIIAERLEHGAGKAQVAHHRADCSGGQRAG